jgi:hypothetical protein
VEGREIIADNLSKVGCWGCVAMRAMLKEQAAQIQKVNAHLELSKPAQQTVVSNP